MDPEVLSEEEESLESGAEYTDQFQGTPASLLAQTEELDDSGGKAAARAATIVDTAKETGFSIATVSRALNGFSNVREITKRRITEAARNLNYVPNDAAINLVRGKTRIIGLLLPDASPIYGRFPSMFGLEMEKRGYRILTFNSNNDPVRQEFLIQQLLQHKVDAALVSPVPGEYDGLQQLQDKGVPLVVFNRFISDFPVSNVVFNFRRGMSEAIDELVLAGRRHFYQFTRQDVYYGLERRDYFYFNLKANGLVYADNRTFPVNDDFSSGYQQMENLLGKKLTVDAILCSSDYSALGAIRCAQDNGLAVPEDVAIIGCYNTDLADFTSPRISSIDASFGAMAKTAADAVRKEIEHGIEGEPLAINLDVEAGFFKRESGP